MYKKLSKNWTRIRNVTENKQQNSLLVFQVRPSCHIHRKKMLKIYIRARQRGLSYFFPMVASNDLQLLFYFLL